ncbi:chitin deacetylase [Chitinispirillum alkaliphilum]|nr:chitin deacetylase [Chitinispirillum alkaliphilum]
MEWTLDLLDGKTNPPGTGNSATFDGEPIRAVFYHTSGALDQGGQELLETWKRAYESGHGVGNHTVTHNTTRALTLQQWKDEISGCAEALSSALGIPTSEIAGFRTPYLDFNAETFQAVADLGLLYETTMTHHQDIHLRQFTWPYTLDNGFAEHVIDGWEGAVKIPGLWIMPVYTVGESLEGPVPMWPPITGFDSSILTQANGSKFEQMFRNAIDYRLQPGGNRAPLTIGLHSDTYAEANPSGANYDGALNLEQRRAALSNIIEYALSKPEVRIVTAVQVIEWMKDPVPLGRSENVSVVENKTNPVERISLKNLTSGSLTFNSHSDDLYSLNIYGLNGQILVNKNFSARQGLNTINFSNANLPAGIYTISLRGQKSSTFSRLVNR